MHRGRTVSVEFGSGLRSHIGRGVPDPVLAEKPFGPEPSPPEPSAPESVPAIPVTEPTQESAASAWVRDLLRARVAEQADRIWAVFDEALRATDANGRPDHELRLRAARALLAEIGPPAPVGDGAVAPPEEASDDDLARLRRAKLSGFGAL